MDDITVIAWQEEPGSRGTFSIVTSCLGTLLICVWSALHVDIQSGKSRLAVLRGRVGWFIIGLIAPELLLFTAFNQYLIAGSIAEAAGRLLKAPPKETHNAPWYSPSRALARIMPYQTPDIGLQQDVEEAKSKDRGDRKHRWTRAHGYYAAMGGFVLQDPDADRGKDDHYLPAWQSNGVLTSDAVLLLMEHEPKLIPDLPMGEIRDRSKANGLAKALLIWQMLWFCLSCANRLAQNLPLCLLEVSTIAHALVTLLTSLVWWSKPKDVQRPTVIREPQSTQDPQSADPQRTNDRARQLGAWMSMTSIADLYFLGGLLNIDCSAEMHYVELKSAAFTPKLPHDSDSRHRSTICRIWKGVVHDIRTWFVYPKGKSPWHRDRHPCTRTQGEACSEKEERQAKKLRWELAAKALENYPSLNDEALRHNPSLTPPPIKAPAAPKHPLIVPVARLQASTDARTHNMTGVFQTALIGGVLTAVYGLPHLFGWNATFRSALEQKLWRIATLVIVTMGFTIGAITICAMLLTRGLQYVLVEWMAKKEYTGIAVQCQRPLERIMLSLGVLLYCVSSAYLISQSFSQLFALPSAAFTVPSFGNYWPHFS